MVRCYAQRIPIHHFNRHHNLTQNKGPGLQFTVTNPKWPAKLWRRTEELSASEGDLQGTQKELDAATAYFEKLKPVPGFVGKWCSHLEIISPSFHLRNIRNPKNTDN